MQVNETVVGEGMAKSYYFFISIFNGQSHTQYAIVTLDYI